MHAPGGRGDPARPRDQRARRPGRPALTPDRGDLRPRFGEPAPVPIPPGVRLRRSDVNGPGYRRRRAGRGFAYYDERRRPDQGRRASTGSAAWRSRRPGGTSGSARGPTGTSRPPASTPRAAGSTATTTSGAPAATPRSTSGCWRSPTSCPTCATPSVRGAAHPGAQPRAGAGHRRPAARPRRLPRRQRAVRGGERHLRAGHAASGTTCPCAASGRSSPTRPRAASSARSRSPTGRRPTVVRQLLERPGRRRRGPARPTRPTDGEWRDVTSSEINAYLKEISGAEITAKDFRTWNATVLMAAALAETPPPASRTARKKAVRAAYVRVSRAARQHPGGLQGQLRRSAGGRPLRARRDRRRRAARGRARPRTTGTPSGPSKQAVCQMLSA